MKNQVSLKAQAIESMLLILFIISLSFSYLWSGERQEAFKARKLKWLEQSNDIFAKANRGENVDDDVKAYLQVAGDRSMRQAQPLTMRILLQYPNSLSESYQEQLTKYYLDRYFGELWGSTHQWIGVSPNQLMNEVAPMYLFCEKYPDRVIHYDLENYTTSFPQSFTYEGRSYSSGNHYNGLQFSRDMIFWVYDNIYLNYDIWANGNDWSFETDNRTYTSAQLVGTLLLRDLARNPEMVHRSDMTFQMMALNMLMDCSAKHWGGSASERDYIQYGVLENKTASMMWSLGGDGNPFMNDFVEKAPFCSPRPFSELFLDLATILDEPNDYYQYNIEMNGGHDWNFVGGSNGYPNEKNCQKWTFCTKYYNLGGSRVQWQLCLRTPQNWYQYGEAGYVPFRMWMNDAESPDHEHDIPKVMGKRNIQYKNALLVLDREKLRFYENLWEHDNGKNDYFFKDQSENWNFFGFKTGEEINDEREVWIAVAKNNSALEVCVVGIDYPTFQDFKNAMNNVAEAGGSYFITSKGDKISTDGYWDYGLVNGKPIWGEYGHPIPRFPWITTFDNKGNKIIDWDWDRLTMKLNKNNMTQVLDFKNWRISGQNYDIDPPNPPANITLK